MRRLAWPIERTMIDIVEWNATRLKLRSSTPSSALLYTYRPVPQGLVSGVLYYNVSYTIGYCADDARIAPSLHHYDYESVLPYTGTFQNLLATTRTYWKLLETSTRLPTTGPLTL